MRVWLRVRPGFEVGHRARLERVIVGGRAEVDRELHRLYQIAEERDVLRHLGALVRLVAVPARLRVERVLDVDDVGVVRLAVPAVPLRVELRVEAQHRQHERLAVARLRARVPEAAAAARRRVAAATRIFRGDESRRRRGYDVDIPRSARVPRTSHRATSREESKPRRIETKGRAGVVETDRRRRKETTPAPDVSSPWNTSRASLSTASLAASGRRPAFVETYMSFVPLRAQQLMISARHLCGDQTSRRIELLCSGWVANAIAATPEAASSPG